MFLACLRTSKQITSTLPRTVGVVALLVAVAFFAEIAFSVSPKASTEVIYGGPESHSEHDVDIFTEGVAYAHTGIFDEGLDAGAVVGSPVSVNPHGAASAEEAVLFSASSPKASGELYRVGPGDTAFTIAQARHVDEKELIRLNRLTTDGPLIVGDQLVLPVVIDAPKAITTVQFNGYLPKGFIWPAKGPIGPAHDRYSARDIPNKVGTPVVASGDGVVLRAPYGWGGGYGNYVLIEHPSLVMPSGFAVETLYGHLSDILVVPGQKVKQGEVIGLMGSTGISTGPHTHFEVRTW